ncbi:short-chain dehydrogenase, partial [Cellulomonas sp. WB94]|uniref:SDR family NAD(P)-dependent oxidoreductase n=1 Tax=Cellulomonas sp. WB94 TaxID=2173174 RepID=UPI000D569A75
MTATQTDDAAATEPGEGVDPADLAVFLRVIDEVGQLPSDHPQLAVARRATSQLFKSAKRQRRTERRDAISTADRAVVHATATGSPGRIDDETQGIFLVATAPGASAGTLLKPRPCYICKELYTHVDAFYHQLCPSCAALNRAKRDARTDLTGKRALLTGGRAKIGMYIALRLLRDGAHTTITTRFPRDAARRFAAMPDSEEWLDRLTIVGIDLRDPAQVVALADTVAAAGPLDILINNAAQTVRR